MVQPFQQIRTTNDQRMSFRRNNTRSFRFTFSQPPHS